MKEVYKTKTLDRKVFGIINLETEEFIDVPGTLKFTEKTNLYRIEFKDYVYLDTSKLTHFYNNGLKLNHLGLLSLLATKLTFTTNCCLGDDKSPLSTNTIAKLIGKSENATKSLLNDLESFGLIWYGKIPDYKKKVYALNPYVIRIGRDFTKTIINNFYESGIKPQADRLNEINKFDK